MPSKYCPRHRRTSSALRPTAVPPPPTVPPTPCWVYHIKLERRPAELFSTWGKERPQRLLRVGITPSASSSLERVGVAEVVCGGCTPKIAPPQTVMAHALERPRNPSTGKVYSPSYDCPSSPIPQYNPWPRPPKQWITRQWYSCALFLMTEAVCNYCIIVP